MSTENLTEFDAMKRENALNLDSLNALTHTFKMFMDMYVRNRQNFEQSMLDCRHEIGELKSENETLNRARGDAETKHASIVEKFAELNRQYDILKKEFTRLENDHRDLLAGIEKFCSKDTANEIKNYQL